MFFIYFCLRSQRFLTLACGKAFIGLVSIALLAAALCEPCAKHLRAYFFCWTVLRQLKPIDFTFFANRKLTGKLGYYIKQTDSLIGVISIILMLRVWAAMMSISGVICLKSSLMELWRFERTGFTEHFSQEEFFLVKSISGVVAGQKTFQGKFSFSF